MACYGGVSRYLKGTAHVPVFLAGEKACCANCVVFCRYEDAFRRYSCRATGEQLLLPFSEIGIRCPIQFEMEEA